MPPPAPAPGARIGQRPAAEVARFLAHTAVLSGAPWTAVLLLGGDIGDPLILVLYSLGACGPSLAALTLRLRGVRSPRTARWARVTGWAPAALLLGALPAVVVATLEPGSGAPGADDGPDVVGVPGGLLVLLLVHTVTGPLSEEFGWRGFLQPRLRRRLSSVGTSFVLGGVWAVWHLPFFAMTGTWQATLSVPEALIYLGMMVPMSMVYLVVTERLRGGVPGAVLLHYVVNVSVALLPPSGLASLAVLGAVWLLLGLLLIRAVPRRSTTT